MPLHGKAFWTSGNGYEIRAVPDPHWTPPTLVLLDPGGIPCGFYSGDQAWVDGEHRGRGLGAELALAMADAIGTNPIRQPDGLGFTEAGFATHRLAWCLAVIRAHAAGADVDPFSAEEAAAELARKDTATGRTP